jgi:hypothetical protein
MRQANLRFRIWIAGTASIIKATISLAHWMSAAARRKRGPLFSGNRTKPGFRRPQNNRANRATLWVFRGISQDAFSLYRFLKGIPPWLFFV